MGPHNQNLPVWPRLVLSRNKTSELISLTFHPISVFSVQPHLFCHIVLSQCAEAARQPRAVRFGQGIDWRLSKDARWWRCLTVSWRRSFAGQETRSVSLLSPGLAPVSQTSHSSHCASSHQCRVSQPSIGQTQIFYFRKPSQNSTKQKWCNKYIGALRYEWPDFQVFWNTSHSLHKIFPLLASKN